ncbi:uncharacterized protein LOC112528578 [Cynara cardunculus var. scolymus]|uniref:Uncharacterized protein n=1 Tax=Cynara cardunculus var. scolymus TaxID=59895 RepID=A0A103XRJ3_CYNCS|nr:uncharacterized protein LOC112528578 [Cynara cardunculus var. scolymus]KVH95567.1 hypothetical protein Ccrd_002324 [Cynara cardunculus var. scolymus]
MRRRLTKKSSAATPNRSPSESPPKFKFNFSCFKNVPTSSASPKKKNNTNSSAEPPKISPAPALSKAPSTLADLKEMTSSNVDSIKRHLDFSHSAILKDVEASHSRLHKRYKIQNQTCQQTMNEAEKEFKKMNDRIKETHDAMQASYMELIAESQASTNRVCKTTIPELLQSVDRAIDALRNRYGIASTTS